MIRYINSQGECAELSAFPTRIREASLHNYSWKYDGKSRRYGTKISRFTKDPAEYEITIAFTGSAKTQRENLNNFYEITERDVMSVQPGKLYFDEYYIECFVIKSTTEPTEFSRSERTVNILAPYPFWIRETTYQYLPEEETGETDINSPVITGKDYTGEPLENGATIREFKFDFLRRSDKRVSYPLFDFTFDFIHTRGRRILDNASFKESEFVMTIYGYVDTPNIIIAGHQYIVNATAFEGERIVIDSRNGTVTKIGRLGERTNLYNSRDKVNSVFEKIPAGVQTISWSGGFGFDITLYDERSEPKWTL